MLFIASLSLCQSVYGMTRGGCFSSFSFFLFFQMIKGNKIIKEAVDRGIHSVVNILSGGEAGGDWIFTPHKKNLKK